ncbi:ATP-binding protein [Gloeocapsopsis sp. IPPAS B-1203]|uniref:sensor histidine kinase n=1 Tax=Gloeocapsopsis sp. IPPAS B-1203 TaxID=2049454 RepID=UPI00117C230A|nr:ATP-binding protein [Gloeocapsopsis sp. IPPAS B-1203]
MTAKSEDYLEMGKTQTQRQEFLIQEILNTFSAEVASLETFTPDMSQLPRVVTMFSSLLVENKIRLEVASKIDNNQDWIIGEKSLLERVLSNLSENAWRHSLSNTNVTVTIQLEKESMLFVFDDEGSGVSPEVATSLFQKFT